MKKLIVEMNADFAKANDVVSTAAGVVAFTPPIDEDYWVARVRLFRKQAIVAFPKFFTIGCGFAQEEDWNTNLPLSGEAEKIYDHIKHNKKHAEIRKADCIAAIRLLQKAVLPLMEKKKKAAENSPETREAQTV